MTCAAAAWPGAHPKSRLQNLVWATVDFCLFVCFVLVCCCCRCCFSYNLSAFSNFLQGASVIFFFFFKSGKEFVKKQKADRLEMQMPQCEEAGERGVKAGPLRAMTACLRKGSEAVSSEDKLPFPRPSGIFRISLLCSFMYLFRVTSKYSVQGEPQPATS